MSLGARSLGDHGVEFRCWGPELDEVYVVGDWLGPQEIWGRPDKWRELLDEKTRQSSKLTGEGNAHRRVWSGTILEARPGHKYCFYLRAQGREEKAHDPYSRCRSQSLGLDGFDGYDVVELPSACPRSLEPHHLSEWIIYQVHPGTFADQNNPAPLEVQLVEHTKKLGATVLQLMPHTHAFKGHHPPRSWGYDPVSFHAPDPTVFKDPASVKRLVDLAHRWGIAVLFDFVPNHFYEVNAFSVWRNLTQAVPGSGSLQFWSDTDWGPAPNLQTPEMREYLLSSARLWLQEYNFDGLRVDSPGALWDKAPAVAACQSCATSFWDDLCHMVSRMGKKLFAENGPQTASAMESFLTPLRKYGPDPGNIWDDHCCHLMFDWFRSESGLSFTAVCKALEQHIQRSDASPNSIVFFENHDKANPHQKGRVGKLGERKSRLATAVLLTLPGVPLIFQGQEFLSRRDFDFEKTPRFDWTLPKRMANVNGFRNIQQLIRIRINYGHILQDPSNFKFLQINAADKVCIYSRSNILVAVNLSDRYFASYRTKVSESGAYRILYPRNLSEIILQTEICTVESGPDPTICLELEPESAIIAISAAT